MKYLLCFFLSCTFSLWGQIEHKELLPARLRDTIVIDGHLKEASWSKTPVGSGFRMLAPDNGPPAPEAFSTRFKVFYDDKGVYFGLIMKDPAPDSILTQITQRDVYNENCDYVLLGINPFNDGLNDFNFALTAAGVQHDSRTTANGDDASLNSIWQSAVQITDSGWQAEIFIPYISLRFPEEQSGPWGFNVIRSIRRFRHTYSWNFIDRGSGYRAEFQCGYLRDIEKIDPPVRLSFMPYVSSYADNFQGQSNYDFNAGMDLKYGLSPGFTLDMTLIPDFGQVAFDNQFLNLSPFENRFQENRQFFTEGTEIFSIGDLFYSRRIGGQPKNITNQNLNDSNIVAVRTEYTRLLNASKVSGRTEGNLGIGILNAITDNNYSLAVNDSGQSQRQLLEPLTNYNVLVLDQRFKRNSSVSFVNTNVTRNGEFLDANVMALLTSLYSKSGVYRVDASLKRSDRVSNRIDQEGYAGEMRFGDVDGQWRWATLQRIQTDEFNINDLGFQTRNNQIRNYSEIQYLTFRPSGPFNRYNLTLYSIFSQLYKPQRYEEFKLGFRSFFLLRDFTGTGLNLSYNPVARFDYFEPRLPGAYLRRPPGYTLNSFLSTDYRKPLALNARFTYGHVGQFNRDSYLSDVELRIRLGDHFFMTPQVIHELNQNDYGFATIQNGQSYMGRRQVKNLSVEIDGRYAFNPVSSLSLRLRHFWSQVLYRQYFRLQEGGQLEPADLNGNYDLNFNTLNLDLRFSWWFAPASEMTILYRVAIARSGQLPDANYWLNLEQNLNSPLQNNLSIKISYFLDYNRTKNFLKS